MTTSSLYPAVGIVATRKLDFLVLDEFEFDLAVLGFSAFRNVETGHNLQARHDGAPIALRDFHVFETVAIDPEAHKRFTFFAIRLDVDIGGACR